MACQLAHSSLLACLLAQQSLSLSLPCMTCDPKASLAGPNSSGGFHP